MMSGGGSSLNGILETGREREKERESIVNIVTSHQPHYKAIYTDNMDTVKQIFKKKTTVRTSRKARGEEREGQDGQMKGSYISRSNKQRRICEEHKQTPFIKGRTLTIHI